MNVTNKKGPTIETGLCRCCGLSKKCRILNVEYESIGVKEVYSEMFVDCFGLMFSHMDGPAEERLICATCVSRLREAVSFRRQVLRCEDLLLQAKIHIHDQEKLSKRIKVEVVKEETGDISGGDDLDCRDDTYEVISDRDEVKVESKSKTEKSPKCKKKVKQKKTNKKNQQVTEKMKSIEEKLRKMETVGIVSEPTVEASPTKKYDDDKAFKNLLTIIENSYVCPFDTSFSDYFCFYCREVFTDPHKLREHALTHDPTTFRENIINKKMTQIDITRIDCRLCAHKIDDLDKFNEHISSVHGKTYYSNISDQYLKFRLTVSNLSCIECSATFGFFHALKKHMAEHFGTCICDVCGAHYFEERMLNIHQKTHQKVDESYPCKECGKIFKYKHSRYIHEARMHKKEPVYQCSKCDEVLFSHRQRYRHMMEAHGEQRVFPCDRCDRVYDSRKSLTEHNRRAHLKVFKHQCDLCDKRFYLPSRLKEHMVTHTGERNFRCEYCGKSYPRLRGLKVHMQSHVSEKKYRCVLCAASFTQNVNLKNHMKRQHQNMEMEDYPK